MGGNQYGGNAAYGGDPDPYGAVPPYLNGYETYTPDLPSDSNVLIPTQSPVSKTSTVSNLLLSLATALINADSSPDLLPRPRYFLTG